MSPARTHLDRVAAAVCALGQAQNEFLTVRFRLSRTLMRYDGSRQWSRITCMRDDEVDRAWRQVVLATTRLEALRDPEAWVRVALP